MFNLLGSRKRIAAWSAGLLLIGAATAVAAPLVFDPPQFDGRIGGVVLRNGYSKEVTVTLWHPDTRKPHASWAVAPGKSLHSYVDGKPIRVGSDWGVQMNGLHIIPIGKAAFNRVPNGGYQFDVDLVKFYK